TRLQRRLETRYLDVIATDIDGAIQAARQAQTDRMARSIGVEANAVELLETFVERQEPVDVVTEQTPAHDPLMYVPLAVQVGDAEDLRRLDPEGYVRRARDTMARHVPAMLTLLDRGAEVFDYGNSLRAEARVAGVHRAFDYPGFVPAYIRPLFCEGKGPFRW